MVIKMEKTWETMTLKLNDDYSLDVFTVLKDGTAEKTTLQHIFLLEHYIMATLDVYQPCTYRPDGSHVLEQEARSKVIKFPTPKPITFTEDDEVF